MTTSVEITPTVEVADTEPAFAAAIATEIATSQPLVSPPIDGLRISVPNTHYVNARSKPSERSDVLAILASGTQTIAIARTDDSAWLQLLLVSGEKAWILAESVRFNADQVSILSVAPQEQ